MWFGIKTRTLTHCSHTKKERVRLATSNPSPSRRPGARTRSRSWQGLARQSSPDHTKFAHSLVRSQVLSVKWREYVAYLDWLRALWARFGFTTSRRWRGSSGFRLSHRSRTLTTATSSRGGAFTTTSSGSVLATTATRVATRDRTVAAAATSAAATTSAETVIMAVLARRWTLLLLAVGLWLDFVYGFLAHDLLRLLALQLLGFLALEVHAFVARLGLAKDAGFLRAVALFSRRGVAWEKREAWALLRRRRSATITV